MRNYPAVLDGAAEYLYEFAVAHCVEEAFKVEVHYILVAFIDYLLHFRNASRQPLLGRKPKLHLENWGS